MSYRIQFTNTEFITEISIAEVGMLIEALDYAVSQFETSDIMVFEGQETALDGAEIARNLSRQLRSAINCADEGTIVIKG